MGRFTNIKAALAAAKAELLTEEEGDKKDNESFVTLTPRGEEIVHDMKNVARDFTSSIKEKANAARIAAAEKIDPDKG